MFINQLYNTIGIITVCLLLIGWIVRLEIKMKRLTGNSTGKSLEESIIGTHKELEILSEFRTNSLAYFEEIEKRLRKSIQAVETVRFNPFQGSGEGGNQSFSTAFINEHGNGVVLTSLYLRDRISIFSKPLKKFSSTVELTEEEKQVVLEARKNIS